MSTKKAVQEAQLKLQRILRALDSGLKVKNSIHIDELDIFTVTLAIGVLHDQIERAAKAQGMRPSVLDGTQLSDSDTPLTKWMLSEPILAMLAKGGITTVGELCSKTETDVSKLFGNDRLYFMSLRTAMDRNNANFRKD